MIGMIERWWSHVCTSSFRSKDDRATVFNCFLCIAWQSDSIHASWDRFHGERQNAFPRDT